MTQMCVGVVRVLIKKIVAVEPGAQCQTRASDKENPNNLCDVQ